VHETVCWRSISRGGDLRRALRALIRRARPLLTLPGGGMPTGLLAGSQPQELTPEELRRRREFKNEQRVYKGSFTMTAAARRSAVGINWRKGVERLQALAPRKRRRGNFDGS